MHVRHFPTPALATLARAPRHSREEVRAHMEMLWTMVDAADTRIHSPLVGFGVGGWLYAAMIANRCVPEPDGRWHERIARLRGQLANMSNVRPGGTFLEGDTGPAALLCALGASDVRALSSAAVAANASAKMPNELLYGRVGVMHSLFVSNAVGGDAGAHGAIVELFDEVVRQGVAEGENRGVPLHWVWHGKAYLGLVHGVAGILCVLLRAWRAMTDDERRVRHASWDSIMRSAEWLTGQTLPSGNLPSHSGSDRDDLVQICHGAPALAIFACVFYRDSKAPVFRECAERAAAVVYERGLLCKGVGLCHGIGGNALALLEVHRITGDAKWLRACWHFIDFAMDHSATPNAPLLQKPDDPLSFLNGVAGFIAALALVLESDTHDNFTFPML